MRFDILTIFPDLLKSPMEEGIIRKARENGLLEINFHNIRDFTTDKHSITDDRPFGGGEGMVMKPEPIAAAIEYVSTVKKGGHVVMVSPQGRKYTQDVAGELVRMDHLILLCGRYEGIDARIDAFIDDEVSIGDYILSGGELAAMVLVDSIARLLPGVVGCQDSVDYDTFSRGLLKHPQYTRPRDFENQQVPDALLSGDHQRIADWRFLEAVKRTALRRPDLLKKVVFTKHEIKLLEKNGFYAVICATNN